MRKIKVLIAILGIDQHEVGAIAVAHFLRNAGMEVVYGGRFNLPPKIVKTAIQEDVDVIGLSCHSWEYLYFIPELMELLTESELDTPVVVGGSVVTEKDRETIVRQGVRAAFGSEATPEQIVATIRQLAGG
ncbi:cobalamin B12-binding domain-containing protein [Thermodesulfobacteriota bacterium]